MAGRLIQPEGLLRCRSIFSALVIAVENKPGDGLPSKRSLYCKSILEFVETHVCSLVYKFVFFFTECVSLLHFAPCQGDHAWIWFRIALLRSGILLLAVYGKDDQTHGVDTKVSQETLEGDDRR